jgi:Serine dehydrogenase proteinase
MEESRKPIKAAADKLASDTDTDVFLYNSGIARPFDDEVISACCCRKRRKNVAVILVTEGGEPDAAFRIARAFQDHYAKFTCIVSGYCKSAGTLILTGANELVMTDWGELGPLDVQMAKKDELGERESGLLVTSALEALRRSAFLSFEHFFLTMQRKSRWVITFKTAAEYASKLTTGLFAPIYGQIDPRLVAESSRAQAIGLQYGSRLGAVGQNIDPDGLNRLIGEYPTHGFVIDRAEAESLFKNVRKPTADETRLIDLLDRLAIDPQSETDGFRHFLSGEEDEQSDTKNANPRPNSGSGDAENLRTAGEGIEQPGATDGGTPVVA